ncbi:hypothetical protein EDC27_1804 [Desulfosoma caldarium]|uniref:Uncharacterized protein n=1 Tax=Desulfosoma caldarium TaxID=610254 RepID=A0A3N1ULL1_9BACT|nr:hypothetical protein EDC27_1804 [Desulfosoma caldarium]
MSFKLKNFPWAHENFVADFSRKGPVKKFYLDFGKACFVRTEDDGLVLQHSMVVLSKEHNRAVTKSQALCRHGGHERRRRNEGQSHPELVPGHVV